MNKIENFLNQTYGITNKERFIAIGCTLFLTVTAEVLNYKLFKSRMDNIDKDHEIDKLKLEKSLLESQLKELNKEE